MISSPAPGTIANAPRKIASDVTELPLSQISFFFSNRARGYGAPVDEPAARAQVRRVLPSDQIIAPVSYSVSRSHTCAHKPSPQKEKVRCGIRISTFPHVKLDWPSRASTHRPESAAICERKPRQGTRDVRDLNAILHGRQVIWSGRPSFTQTGNFNRNSTKTYGQTAWRRARTSKISDFRGKISQKIAGFLWRCGSTSHNSRVRRPYSFHAGSEAHTCTVTTLRSFILDRIISTPSSHSLMRARCSSAPAKGIENLCKLDFLFLYSSWPNIPFYPREMYNSCAAMRYTVVETFHEDLNYDGALVYAMVPRKKSLRRVGTFLAEPDRKTVFKACGL